MPGRRLAPRFAASGMLTTGETYADPGGDYYTRRDPARTTRRLVAQLERLGPHGHAPGGRYRLTNGIFASETTSSTPRGDKLRTDEWDYSGSRPETVALL